MFGIFSPMPVNTARQSEIDLAKVFAVFFMTLFFVIEISQVAIIDFSSPFQSIAEFAAGPLTPPIFLICMGIGIVYSKKNTPEQLFIRGLKLIVIGWAVTLLKYIPYSVYSFNLADLPLNDVGYPSVFAVNILRFAGLAFWFFAIIKKLKTDNFKLVLITIVLVSCGSFLNNSFVQNIYTWEAFLYPLFKINDSISFPFLVWIAYPVIGYLFAQALIRCENKKNFYSDLFIANIILFYAMYVVFDTHLIPFFPSMIDKSLYYCPDVLKIIANTSACFIWLSVLYFISKTIGEGQISKLILHISKNITLIYFFGWIIILWTLIPFGQALASKPLLQIIASLAVIATADISASCFMKIKNKFHKNENN